MFGKSKLELEREIEWLKEEKSDLKCELVELKTKMKEEKLAVEFKKKEIALQGEFDRKQMALQSDYHNKYLSLLDTEKRYLKDTCAKIMGLVPNIQMRIQDGSQSIGGKQA